MKKYQFQPKDFLIGLFLAIGTSVGQIIYTTVQAGSLQFDWKAIANVALTTAIMYIGHKFLTDDVAVAQKTLKKQK